ncbi:MAG: hypothetical protein U5R14_12325 [Gemmatimonadota bacterium]|nr:hypothetical protein [Gemmatimonadota bacterium]
MASSPGLRVYLDCQRCDFDFIREEVPAVDYVRDQGAADVHVLVTQEPTGSGGQEYTFHFMGREELAGRADTLRYTSGQTDTDDEVRRGYAHTFGVGLVRYLAYASEADRVDLSFMRPDPTADGARTAQEDPWNLWVFRTSMSGEIEGESLQRSRAVDGSFSASRTTEEFKIDVNLRGEYEWEEFDFEQDDGSIESRTSSATELDASTTAVWSLGPNWSWGLSADVGSDSPSNQDFFMRGGPALEFSLYPYAESTSRQITALYRIGGATFQYQDTTVFGQLAETRPEHSLQISADFRQPWGEFVLSVEGSHYLDDITQHRVDVFSNLEIRLFQGFNLDIRGNVARIKDQIYLSVSEIDIEDRITGRQEIGTDFEYSLDVGFSFTFGSVFNNVVNPRIRTGGGGRFFF